MNKEEMKIEILKLIDYFPEEHLDSIDGYGLLVFIDYHPEDPLCGLMSIFSKDVSSWRDERKFAILQALIQKLNFLDTYRLNQLTILIRRLMGY